MISRPFRRIELPSALRAFLGQCSLPAIGQCRFLSGNARFNAEREEDREDRSALSVVSASAAANAHLPVVFAHNFGAYPETESGPDGLLGCEEWLKDAPQHPGDMPDPVSATVMRTPVIPA